jgi:hypothetical protein
MSGDGPAHEPIGAPVNTPDRPQWTSLRCAAGPGRVVTDRFLVGFVGPLMRSLADRAEVGTWFWVRPRLNVVHLHAQANDPAVLRAHLCGLALAASHGARSRARTSLSVRIGCVQPGDEGVSPLHVPMATAVSASVSQAALAVLADTPSLLARLRVAARIAVAAMTEDGSEPDAPPTGWASVLAGLTTAERYLAVRRFHALLGLTPREYEVACAAARTHLRRSQAEAALPGAGIAQAVAHVACGDTRRPGRAGDWA